MSTRIHHIVIMMLLLAFIIPAASSAQDIYLQELSTALLGASYSGICIQDDYAYCATCYGFKVLDISDPENIIEILHFPTDGIANNLMVEDDYLFICDSEAGLLAYNISDIMNPVLTDILNPPGFIRSVCSYGNYLFAAAEDYGLQIIDRSDVYNLELVDIIYPGGEVKGVALYDNYLYATLGIAGMVTYNIYNPENPIYQITWNTLGGNAMGICSVPSEEILFMCDGSNGIHILDLDIPWIPNWTATFATPGAYIVTIDVSAADNYGIGTFAEFGVQTFDFSGTFLDSLDLGRNCMKIKTYQDYSYVCRGDSGLFVVNTQNPNNITLANEVRDPMMPFKVTVVGNIAYVAARTGGMAVLDVSLPQSPQLLQNYPELPLCMDVKVTEDTAYLYAADFDSGLYVFDLADMQNPVLLNNVNAIPSVGGHDIIIDGDYLYLIVFDFALNVFDISDRENPLLLWNSPDTLTRAREFALSEDGQYLYVCAENYGFHIYTNYLPDSMHYEYTLDYFELPSDIVIDGDYAYLADWEEGLYVLDISNYAYIFKVDSLPAQGANSGVALIDEQYIAVCDWTAGVAVIDVSDPLNIFEVDRHETPGYAHNAFSDGICLYVCDTYDLMILDLYGVGVNEEHIPQPIPDDFAILYPAYPNPFNSNTNISFEIPIGGRVYLAVYNINGELVQELLNSYCTPSKYQIPFSAKELSSGVYFAQLKFADSEFTQKILLVK